jgi:hypothetical protein
LIKGRDRIIEEKMKSKRKDETAGFYFSECGMMAIKIQPGGRDW